MAEILQSPEFTVLQLKLTESLLFDRKCKLIRVLFGNIIIFEVKYSIKLIKIRIVK